MNFICCDTTSIPISSCPMHSHNSWEIIYNLSGTVTATINQKKYIIYPKNIIIIPPYTMHNNTSDMFFTDMFIKVKQLDFEGVTILTDRDNTILSLMKITYAVFIEKELNYKQICDNIVNSISLLLQSYNSSVSKHDFVSKLKKEIHENFSNSDYKTTNFISANNLNADYVRKCFKSELNVTPLEYLTKLRLNRAKYLLVQETYMSIVDIAAECGFNDSFYFSKLFKKYYGISPLNYRKTH